MLEQRMTELRDIAAEVFAADPEKVEKANSFIHDLDADSLLIVELLAQIEQRYDVTIDEGDARRMTDLHATYEIVAQAAGW
ncbi:acyl carrier protein [Streptomyces sp. NBC_00564]|uniref:acyl carrier protein n=1 Tax=Streptomyces sp. NBC_00564 TaxID=2903663 RepID=UPI00352DFAB2|nr:phosphopantetheine-binding protein [Streptomyces sp. NBC_00564]